MDRRKFIKQCCIGAGIAAISPSLIGCAPIHYANVTVESGKITIPKSEFTFTKGETVKHRKFVLVQPKSFNFPICLYQINETDYSASLLKCTHRACELNVGGSSFTCPCHGSEFSVTGKLITGPAETDLQKFKLSTDDQNIYLYV